MKKVRKEYAYVVMEHDAFRTKVAYIGVTRNQAVEFVRHMAKPEKKYTIEQAEVERVKESVI